MKVSSETPVYQRTDDVVETKQADVVVLLHLKNWNYFEFDAVGSAIWSLLEEPRSLPALVESLTTRFNVDEERCRVETKEFLDGLITQGLASISDQPQTANQ